MIGIDLTLVVLQSGLVPRGSRVEVFNRIFTVFLILGALVGVVVIAYMLYNAYKYRDGEHREDGEYDVERPTLGELPTGGGGGRKLFLSFSLSTIIVVSLIVWTYGTLLYVEADSPAQGEDTLEVTVVGYRFGWKFIYPNGVQTGVLRVPEDRPIRLTITSEDVFHNFGIPELRVKSDAIPGYTTDTWFMPEETGTYQAQCFELCGIGHSTMNARVVVMEQAAFEAWYANTTNASDTTNASGTTSASDTANSTATATDDADPTSTSSHATALRAGAERLEVNP